MFQIKWIWENLKGYRGLYITALCMSVVIQAFYLTTPIISQQIVDNFISSDNAVKNLNTRPDFLIMLLILMVGTTFLRTVIQYSANMIYEVTSQGMIYKIRNHLFRSIQNQDMSYYDKNRTGDLMTRLTGDLDMVRHFMSWILKTVVESLFLFTSTAVYFLIINWKMALCLLVLTPLIFLITILFKKRQDLYMLTFVKGFLR